MLLLLGAELVHLALEDIVLLNLLVEHNCELADLNYEIATSEISYDDVVRARTVNNINKIQLIKEKEEAIRLC